tara:strand:- start:205 stop:696 length:492 start_codon:yes stop_codon:yes gene_type:complete
MKNFLFIFLSINLLIPNVQKANSDELSRHYLDKYNEAIDLINNDKHYQAEKKCEEVIKLSPDDKMGYLCKGISEGFSSVPKKYEALKSFTKAIEIDPEFHEAYYWRGALQFSMGRNNMSKLDRTACNDIKKAYLNEFTYAIDYVNESKAFLRRDKCTGFFNYP